MNDKTDIFKFDEYFISLDLKGVFLEKCHETLTFYDMLFNDITDAFVSEYIDSEGKRQYESLWLFSENYLCEAKQFLTIDDFDYVPIKNKITRWNIKKKDFIKKNELDISHINSRSRITLEIMISPDTIGTLKASKDNCGHLWKIFRIYIIPNIMI